MSISISFLLVALAIYAGLYYSAGPKRAVPVSAHNYSLGIVLRHFFLGIVTLFAFDGAVFHSGFYTAFLKRDSYAGNVALIVAQERARPRSETRQEIALIGDSQMFEAFSAKTADARATDSDLRFINLAAPRCALRAWYYVLRELDPRANRYRAIVIPVRYDELDRGQPSPNDVTDISLAAPFLRYSDAFDFARSFPKWPDQCRAFISCILRGYAFRDDLHDLLTNPRERSRLRQADWNFLAARYEYAGSPRSLAGITYNSETKEVSVPEHLIALRTSVQDTLRPHKNRGVFKRYRARWLRRILDRYDVSPTTIVLVQMPEGPLGAGADSLTRDNSIETFVHVDDSIALSAHLFDGLERPEFYADASHLNTTGREKFTQILTDELRNRFQFSSKVETAASSP